VQLRKTELEWTRFDNGFFLDYYGPPSLKSYMTPVTFVVDVVNKKASIPGTGNEPMTFTYTFDVAKFVVAVLDLPRWDEVTYCYGEKTTWNKFVKQAEETTGEIMLRNTIIT
jgi:nucleoside-diphosphate-sugar epimerase